MKELLPLNKLLLKYKAHLFGGILFVTISNLFGIFPAQLTRNALDLVAANIDTYRLFQGFGLQNDVYELLMFNVFIFGILVLSMALMKGLFMFFMRQTIIVMSRHIEYDLKNEIYAHYQQLGMRFYNRNNTGDLMNRISEDVGRVRMYVGPAIMYSINMLVMFVLVISAMYSVNPRLATYVLLPLPVMTYLVYFVHDRINKRSEGVQEQLSTLSTFVQETFSGIRLIKAYSREEDFLNFYKKQTTEYADRSMDLVKVNALFMPTMSMLVGLSTILTIYLGSLEVINGSLTLGNIAEFVIYVNMLTWPVASLGWVITIVQRAAASQSRISEFLKEQPDIVSGPIHCERLKGSYEFVNVALGYEKNRPLVLNNISFKIEAGTSMGIIGRTGAGKSSIVNLLMRLADPEKGKILLDNQDLKSYDINSYRRRIGWVPQDVFLFSDTIAANIGFGLFNEEYPAASIESAAKNAEVYDNIIEFPEGFNTRIGERGITLSGGQKQRISIARAIIRDPDVLIFDDCLSAVDTITEEKILSRLGEIMKNKTSIFVSHRVATVKLCSKIIVIDEGQLVEEGTHEELLLRNGLYAQLFEKQLMENMEKKSEE